MKKILLRIALFAGLVALVDVAAGVGFSWLERHAKGGYTYRDQFICNRLETDILVAGSSRCVRHYNPRLISGALGMSCYNAGQMVILNYGRFRMIAERKKLRIVIYDVHPDFDLLVRGDNHRYLGWLKSHYDRDGIAAIFESIDKTEKSKMLSRMYRYNSRIIELLADCLHPVFNARAGGFKPTGGARDRWKIQEGKDLSRRFRSPP